MQSTIKVTIILLVIFIIGTLYFSIGKNTNYNTKNLVGKKLTEINLKNLDNSDTFTNKDFEKNNYTLINFWASWCSPCRIEHPILMELSKEAGLKILGVNFKDKKINALKFLEELGNPYKYLAQDSDGKQSVNYGIYGIPETILIDKDFIILKKFIGPLTMDDLNEIKSIIN